MTGFQFRHARRKAVGVSQSLGRAMRPRTVLRSYVSHGCTRLHGLHFCLRLAFNCLTAMQCNLQQLFLFVNEDQSVISGGDAIRLENNFKLKPCLPVLFGV